MLFDSCLNYAILIEGVTLSQQCILGIFITQVPHQIAWISIVLRAYRIRKFFDIFDEEFKLQENYKNKIASNRQSFIGEHNDDEIDDNKLLLSKIHKLKEFSLIKTRMLGYASLTTTFGILALIIPYFYAVVPAYEVK